MIKNSLPAGDRKFPRFGVILDSENDTLKEAFLRLKEEFKLRDTDFYILVCREATQKEDVYQGLTFSRKDLNWRGKIKNGEVISFSKTPMDVLVSFTENECKLATFLVSISNADLKVGRAINENAGGLFDITINTGYDEIELFLVELKKYLRIIKNYSNE